MILLDVTWPEAFLGVGLGFAFAAIFIAIVYFGHRS